MPLRDDLLNSIPGENPSGADLRYENSLLVYDKIKEARRQEDDLDQGAWEHDRKVADYAQVAKLAQDALAEKTKDLQLAAWLTEAQLRLEGFDGLRQGLELCYGLCETFWDTLYPPIEDGDLELRIAPLDWLTTLQIPLKSVPLATVGYDFLKYQESRSVGYEDQAQTDKDKENRAKKIAEGKLEPEVFDKAFGETPKAFYVQAEKSLDACLNSLGRLDALCTEKCGSDGPSFSKLKGAIEEVRRVVHTLLNKKRETEPDPVEAAPTQEAAGGAAGAEGQTQPVAANAIVISVMTSSEPADRREVIASVARAAAFLRRREPHSPAPFLMMRGLRWGELRAAAQLSDATLLEAPPTELRQHLKRLALSEQWNELLQAAENAMSLPCSRAWLDLQRLVVEACTGLGADYEPIAAAIRAELATLLHDVPELLTANLMDDTPAANSETREWLAELIGPGNAASPSPAPLEGTEPAPDAEATPAAAVTAAAGPSPSWPARAADSYVLAQQALRAGQAEKAIEIMSREVDRQRSGRGRFIRTMQLVQICIGAGKDAVAQPLLDDLAAAIETHKLDSWENKEMVAAALAILMTASTRIKENADEQQQLFERICRLDPLRASSVG